MICDQYLNWRAKDPNKEKKNFPIYKDGYVIFKPDPTDHKKRYMVFCNKKDKNKCEFYQVLEDRSDASYSLPLFVTELNQSLFERIDGIIYYSYKTGANGWLLLFNINGRAKYCFTSTKRLSNGVSVCLLITKSNSYFQCKSEQNMKSLLSECFQKSPPIPDLTTDLPTDATQETESESFLVKHMIVISISVTTIALILIVVTTALIYRCRQKKVSTLTSSSQYSTIFGKPSGKSIAQSIENAKQRKKDKRNKN